MNKDLFEKLGFSPNEIAIYKALLKTREAAPVELTRLTGIKRTTCYSLARGLAEKGFLYEDATKRPKKFILVPPSELKSIVEHERKQAEEREAALSQFSEQLLQHEAKTSYPVPEIRFIEESKLEAFLYKRSPVWFQSIADCDQTHWGFQDHMFVEQYLDWIKWFWKTAPENMELKLLSNESAIDQKLAGRYKRRLIKVLPGATDFLSTIWVMGDYIFFLYSRETPMHAVEIHSTLLARDLRTIFKKMWEI
jgi:predicted DNA-binding transcriptional regulator